MTKLIQKLDKFMGFSAEVSVPMHELKGIFTALSIIRF
jgi:hypothetical protein